jgi:hypothetical protein
MISSERDSKEALACARKALEEHDRFWLGNVSKMEAEFYELGLLTEEERYMAIDIALIEIVSGNRKGPSERSSMHSNGSPKISRSSCTSSLRFPPIRLRKNWLCILSTKRIRASVESSGRIAD